MNIVTIDPWLEKKKKKPIDPFMKVIPNKQGEAQNRVDHQSNMYKLHSSTSSLTKNN